MKNVLQACDPRPSIVQGTFNAEIFTAALGPVIEYYRCGNSQLDSIYTDAETFFRAATYVTDGLKTTVNNIFQRIDGDMSAPSIQRLETAFGGGKTHTLIACVHIANRGKEIAPAVKEIIDEKYLPEAGSVKVVGIAGDEIKLSKTKAGKVLPYTLWGEIALQIGGEELYKKVLKDVESYAAPGLDYFENVLGDKKLLIMFDELAQYASKLETYNRTSNQLAAFLMALNGYVRNRSGIAVVVTLAGSSDAFAKETEKLSKVLNDISKENLTQDDVLGVVGKATAGLKSVLMRDASAVTPVQANEISAVLAKRLFVSIDHENAKEVASAYMMTYEKNRGMLPQEATSINFKDRMVSHYPFHPTLIDFLNNKLAQAPNFQGTRGVLRTLAMTVRSIWKEQKDISLIHVSDIDMRNSTIVDEILGKTDSSELKTVLNADIGSVDTSSSIKGGLSNAQIEDAKNPHPDHVLMYENTWKVVFLNSLVGRADGYTSNVFGVAEQDAIFQTATPLLLPSQVRVALEKIQESAFYLRYEHSKYFAHTEPTINSVLARIRETIESKRIVAKLRSVANDLIRESRGFSVIHNVSLPADVPDNYEKPVVAVIAIDTEKINVQDFYTYKANGQFRTRKNILSLLIPKTVQVDGLKIDDGKMASLYHEFDKDKEGEKELARAQDLARQVLAINILAENSLQYGINPSKLQDADFRERQANRPQELKVAVASLYTKFCYWSVNGLVKKDIPNVSGDSGDTIIKVIEDKLVNDNELLLDNTDKFAASMLQSLSENYFFKKRSSVGIKDLLNDFLNVGQWPILADKNILSKILRDGVACGIWAVYKDWTDPNDTRPSEIYYQENPLPLSIDLLGSSEFKVTTVAFAKKNGWLDQDKPTDEKVKSVIKQIMQNSGAVTIKGIEEQIKNSLPKADREQVYANIKDLATSGGYAVYKGSVAQNSKPAEEDIYEGFSVPDHDLGENEVLISKKERSERGWLDVGSNELRLSGVDGDAVVEEVFALLGRIGSLYSRGKATTDIKELDIYGLKLPGGGSLRITLDNAEAIDFKRLDEFFADLHSKLKVSKATSLDITIDNPDDKCELVQALKKIKS